METDKYLFEEWRDVRGYEGLYQVSNLGRVRSMGRYVKNKHGMRWVPQKIKALTLNQQGYVQIKLYKNNKPTSKYVHRLVGEAFVPNPYNLPEIDHIDCVKTNNIPSNLRWVDRSGNSLNSITRKRRSTLIKDLDWTYEKHPKAKAILQMTLSGEFVKEWPCIKTASEALGINSALITMVAKNYKGHTSAGGYVWKYKKEG